MYVEEFIRLHVPKEVDTDVSPSKIPGVRSGGTRRSFSNLEIDEGSGSPVKCDRSYDASNMMNGTTGRSPKKIISPRRVYSVDSKKIS